MPLITIGAGISDLEPGSYPVTVVHCVRKTIPGTVNDFNPTGADQEVYEWTFNVDTDDDEVIEVQGITSTKTGEGARLIRHLTALLGPDALHGGAAFEESDLIGKSAIAQVGLNKKGYARVEELFAIPKTTKPKAKPAPVAVEEEDEVEAPAPKTQRKPLSAQVADEDESDLPF